MPISKIKTSSILADAASTNLNIDAGTLFLDATNNRVGISTTTPTAKLHVTTAGVASVPATSGTTLATGTLIRLGTSSDSAGGIGTIGLSTNQMWIQVTDSTNLSTGHALLLNPNGGNVGIGTTSPSTKLHVAGTSAIARIDRTADASANPELQLTAVARQFNVGVGGATFATAALQGSYYLFDSTASAYRMVIDSSGNVGIGTTAPTTKLHISDVSQSIVKIVGSTGVGHLVANGTQVYLSTESAIPLAFYTNQTERMRMSGAAVIIGYNQATLSSVVKEFATPHAAGNRGGEIRFGINDGSFGGIIIPTIASSNPAYNAQDIRFETHQGGVSAGERMRITADGFVGIGTSSPGQKLEISGGSVGIGTDGVNNVFDAIAAARPLVVQKSDSSTTLNGSTAAITIVNSNTTTSNTAQLNFAAITGASTNQYSSAVISTIFGPRTNGQYPTGIMTFSTSTTLNTAPTEKMRITSGGYVAIGTDSSNAGGQIRQLTLSGSGATEFVIRDTTQAADSKNWRMFNASSALFIGTLNDAGSAGTDVIIADRTGRVRMPNQPYLHATVSNGTTAINFGTTHANVTVPYNQIITNTGSHFNTTTNTFTCPVAGVYAVYAAIQVGGLTPSGTGVAPNMGVSRNGGNITGSFDHVGAAGYQKMETTAYIKCATNDTLTINLYTGSELTGGLTEFNGDARNALCIAFMG